MKKGFFLFSFLLFIPYVTFASQLNSINFTQSGEVSRLEFLFDQNDIVANKFNVAQDKQIILDIKNVTSTERVMRAFDTSEFSGSIVFVSAYRKPGSPNDIRVAIQLRDNVRSNLKRRPNRLILEIENRFGVFTQTDLNKGGQIEEEISSGRKGQLGKFHVPKSEAIEDILENLTLSGRKKYIGKKISFNVVDMKVEDIIKLIADASGFNIIISKEVKNLPPLTLNLTNVAWDQALDTILGLNKLIAKKNGEILMISTLRQETEDKKLEVEAKKLITKDEPLVTKVFGISYATTTDMSKILKDYLTPGRGTVAEDKRINALIVKDTAEVIERIKKIIESLDTQTPQVLIQSKIVEVSEEYRKEIGLQNGINFGYDPVGTTDGQEDVGPGFAFSSAPSAGDGGRTLFGLTVERFNRLLNLNFQLQLMESESKAKIIASPKVITQNKKAATISTTDTTSFSVTTQTESGTTQGFQQATATLSLNVTPQVTNEGSISLDISLAKQQFGTRPSAEAPPNQQGRNITTSVLVDNGSTIVLGGIYTFDKRSAHSGVPFLKDIPLLGWLFRTAWKPEMSKNEMVIFLTPRIINQEEAGLSDSST